MTWIFFPGTPIRWGIGHMINLERGPSGRGGGTLSWAGLRNSYYWLDPAAGVAGIIMAQLLPFADPAMLAPRRLRARRVRAGLHPSLPRNPRAKSGKRRVGGKLAEAR